MLTLSSSLHDPKRISDHWGSLRVCMSAKTRDLHFDPFARLPDRNVASVFSEPLKHICRKPIVEAMTNSAIRQGSPGPTQRANIEPNIEAAKGALTALEGHLGQLNISPEALAGIKVEIARIKAQLAKSEPSHPIIREAAHSIRKVAEEVMDEVVTPGAVATINALGKATGAF